MHRVVAMIGNIGITNLKAEVIGIYIAIEVDGLEIAKEYNLPPSIYPFILEHHGDSIASYFYIFLTMKRIADTKKNQLGR